MKIAVVLGLVAGALLTTLLVIYLGVGHVVDAISAAGMLGLIVVTLAHLPSMIICGLAWRCLLRKPPRRASLLFVKARWIRDAASSLIPVLPVSGELAAVRLLALHGVRPGRAGATVVVDVTSELISQFLFTLMGLCLLIMQKPGNETVYWASIGVGVSVPVLIAFVLLQNSRVFMWLEHMSEKLAQSWNWQGLRGLHRSILVTYGRRRRLYAAIVLHLVAWLAGAAEGWVGLHFLGHPLGIGEIFAIESLVYALRSVAFFIPSAVGVQEGAYVLLGSIYGVPPEIALALSLLKRGREVILGIPGLFVWQWMESGRLWRRKAMAARSTAEIS